MINKMTIGTYVIVVDREVDPNGGLLQPDFTLTLKDGEREVFKRIFFGFDVLSAVKETLYEQFGLVSEDWINEKYDVVRKTQNSWVSVGGAEHFNRIGNSMFFRRSSASSCLFEGKPLFEGSNLCSA